MCRHCSERFFAKSERSVWGPSPNERLPIYHERRISKREGTVGEHTGLYLTAVESSEPQFLQIEPALLRCPCCHKDEALCGTLSAGDACPQCHTGTIIDDGLVEY